MVIRLCRQPMGKIDSSSVEELTAWRHSDQYRGVAVLNDTHYRGMLPAHLRY